MNFVKKWKRGMAFFMVLLMVTTLVGSHAEAVFAEETEKVQETVPEEEVQSNAPEKEEQAPVQFSVSQWSWNADGESLQWSDQKSRWELKLPDVSEKNPMTSERLEKEYLPKSVKATILMDTAEERELKLSWNLTDFPEKAWKGEYKVTASLDKNFVLAEGTRPLEVAVILGGEEKSSPRKIDDHIVDGMTPKGTTIDLFDYWTLERDSNDRIKLPEEENGGINKNHNLKFTHGLEGFGNMNQWTGSSASPRKDIVKNKLGENGYPQLSGNKIYGQGTESLNYLFDPSIQHEGKLSFDNVGGLLQVDEEGYYYYNCQENYAAFNENTKQFKLYNKPGVYTGDAWTKQWTTNGVNNGQFFPFDAADGVFTESGSFVKRLNQLRVSSKSTVDSNGDLESDKDRKGNLIFCEKPFNHYFGLTMNTQFIQKDGGYTDNTPNKKKVTYEFSGDDDVWVFIDNVLVADLGGIHSRATLKIDFATGKIYINDKEDGTLRDKFDAAGVKGYFSGNTFADDTYHTLDFFYLERGNSDSNMHLKFNLVTVPESEIVKVDQIGEAVPGAEFALYHTGEDYVVDSRSELIATGTTDKDGQFVLVDDQGRLVSLQRLSEKYPKECYFVLRETKVPEGYRPAGNGDLKLYIPENAIYPVLLAKDSWYTGSRALAKLMTSSSPEITLVPNAQGIAGPNGNKNVDLSKQTAGKMFAVILQYDHSKNGSNMTDQKNWHAVSGDPINGWRVQDGTDMASVIEAAKDNECIFEADASGAFKAEVKELPGDVLKYYFMQLNPKPENTDYTVAYYYTTRNTLQGATAQNTWRVDSANFERMFAARLYIPNIENHVYVKKVDENGKAVNGAKFGLYRETNAGVQKNPDGTVTISENAKPDYEQTTDTLAGYPFKEAIEGALVFPRDKGLPMGTYYLKELSAPDGYALNPKVTKVVIDNSGVYADAGDADDGIRVGRSIGMIVKSMVQFAAGDDVDNTLHDLITYLKVSDNYTGADTQWSYAEPKQENYLRFQPDDTRTMLEYAALEGSKSMVEVEEGWSRFEVKQNYEDTEHGVTSDLKMDWREYDLRNLFSGLLFVTVTNERVGNLEVSKQVQSDLGIDENKEFTFKITLEGAVKPDEVYRAQITDMAGNPEGAEFAFRSNQEVKLKHDQKLTIYKLPYDTKYTVTEKNALGYTPSVTINGVHTDGTVSEEGYTVSGQIAWTDNTDIVEQVAYTNTYARTGKFDFTKTDKDGNALAGAKFAMYRLDCKEETNHHHAEELLKVDGSGELTDEAQKNCWTLEALAESQTDGKVSFENLKVAEEYRLVEYKAAPGYVTPKGQWRVVYADGKFVFPSPDGIGGVNSGIGNPPAVEMNGDAYSIANYKPTELPFSGNRGIKAFLILGILFMTVGGLGGLLWQFKKNKKI